MAGSATMVRRVDWGESTKNTTDRLTCSLFASSLCSRSDSRRRANSTINSACPHNTIAAAMTSVRRGTLLRAVLTQSMRVLSTARLVRTLPSREGSSAQERKRFTSAFCAGTLRSRTQALNQHPCRSSKTARFCLWKAAPPIASFVMAMSRYRLPMSGAPARSRAALSSC
jgi:hypothetical protein